MEDNVLKIYQNEEGVVLAKQINPFADKVEQPKEKKISPRKRKAVEKPVSE